jgi:poly-gamma-glutamate synthesis protein (capsule biosynthesis protein)
MRLGLLAVSDHPAEYAARPGTPGIAHADLTRALPAWLAAELKRLRSECELVVAFPHWGPNMNPEPGRWQVKAAARMLDAGATLVAGHSAHVFHGVAPRVLYDLGDFIDDYAVDRRLRNDLGLLFLVDLAGDRLEAIPLRLEFAHTRLATDDEAAWIRRRFTQACAAFGTEVAEENGRLVCRWRSRTLSP